MATIYAVSSGEYSDYGIEAIFSSLALAEAWIASFPIRAYGERRIEEYELDPLDLSDGSRRHWFVRLQRETGAVKECNQDDYWSGESTGMDVKDGFYTHCFATDEKHAIKIANERRIQWMAKEAQKP